MKRLLFCTGIVFLLALSSCSTTEEIWINPDGSLRREYIIDMSGMMPFIKMAQAAEEEPAPEMEAPPDSLEILSDEPVEHVEEEEVAAQEEEDEFDKMFSELLERENVDTIIAFRSLLTESLEEEGVTEDQLMMLLNQADEEELPGESKNIFTNLVKTVMDARLRIKMSEAENTYFFSLIQDFESADGMNFMQDALTLLSLIGGGSDDGGASAQNALMNMTGGQQPEYSLEKRKFRIYRPALDLTEARQEEGQEDLQMMQMLMGATEHQYVLHFPKKVKKVNIKGAEIDGNTVRVSMPLPEPGKKNEEFELIVKFK